MTTATFGGEFDGTADLAARCPWKGLDSYEPSDAALFVGRERVVRQLLEVTKRSPLAGVVGASGSGKSSLLLAGLSQHAHELVIVRPGADPRAAWRSVVDGLARPGGADAAERPMVVVDQLEEVFTSCDDEDERAAFLDELVSTAASGRADIVVALRSDHYGSCAPYQRFAEALSRAHLLLGAPSHDELRRMITVPAHAASLRLERGLDDEIIDDVLGEAGALPLLSHALRETWLRRDGDLLTRNAYTQAGGVRGAIARTAEATWSELPERQRAAVRDILTRLGSTVSNVESAHRVPIAELLAPGDADAEAALDALVRSRLVTVDNATAEVTHEAVFRSWPRLRTWLAQDRDARRVLAQLRASATAWDDEGRDETALYRGARLQAVVEFGVGPGGTATTGNALDAVSRAFLDASLVAAQQAEAELRERARNDRRRNRRLRALLAGACVLVVVLAATGVFALRQRSVALDRQRIAEARRLAAVAAGVREDRLDLATLLSIEALERHDDLETRGALLSTLTDQVGLRGYLHQADATVDSAIDSTGTLLALPAHDYRLELWDISSSSPTLARIVDLGDEVAAQAVRFTADGRLLVGDTAGGTHLVDPATGAIELTAARRAGGAVWSVAVDPAGTVIASGAEDTLVHLVDATTGRALRAPLAGPADVVYAVEFSADGRTLVAGGGDGVLHRWDTGSWEPAGDPIAFDGGIWDVVWIDDATLAVATDLGVQFVDPITGLPVQPPLAAHDGITYRAVVIDGGATLVTSGEDGFIRFWDLATRAQTRPALHPHAAGARITLAPDAARMVSSSDDGTSAIWDLTGGTWQATPVAERPDGRTQIVTSADGRIFTGDRSGVVREWRPDGRPVTDGAPLSDVPISGLAVSGDGSRVAIARDGGTAQVFDVATGVPVTPVLAVGEITGAVALDAAGRRLVTVQGDRDCTSCFAVHDLDVPTAEPRRLRSPGLGPDRTAAGAAAAFDPSGGLLVTADRTGWVDAWDVATGDHRWGVQLERGVRSLAFSPDGARLAVGGNTGMLLELDALTGARQQQLDGHAGPVVTVAYSPDGALLASASSQDHELRVWRLDLGLTIGRPIWLGFDGSATVAWTDDGRQVVAPHLLAGAMVFDLDAERSIAAACHLAGRNLTLQEWRQYFGDAVYRPTCEGYPNRSVAGSAVPAAGR